jgi:hypothetical protein
MNSSRSSNVMLQTSGIGSPQSAARPMRLPAAKNSSAVPTPTCSLFMTRFPVASSKTSTTLKNVSHLYSNAVSSATHRLPESQEIDASENLLTAARSR